MKSQKQPDYDNLKSFKSKMAKKESDFQTSSLRLKNEIHERFEKFLEKNAVESDDEDYFEIEIKRKIDYLKTALNKNNENQDKFDEDFHVDSDNVLESYYNYSVQTVGLLYFPLFLLIIWIFYDETYIMGNWNIPIQHYIYYFIFSVVIIPFQIIIDIFCYNIMDYFFEYDYLVALKKWDDEWKSRKNIWACSDDLNYNLEPKLRTLAKLNFSSQYYFVATLAMSGLLYIVIGIMSI